MGPATLLLCSPCAALREEGGGAGGGWGRGEGKWAGEESGESRKMVKANKPSFREFNRIHHLSSAYLVPNAVQGTGDPRTAQMQEREGEAATETIITTRVISV